MERWTQKDLENVDDITFAVTILEERKKYLSEYSPLAMKIEQAEETLARIGVEKAKYLKAITRLDMTEEELEAADKLEREIMEGVWPDEEAEAEREEGLQEGGGDI